MPTPNFNFRLSRDRADSLRSMAKLYGSSSTSEFLREMVGAMCSGDAHKVADFNGKLMQKVFSQLTLQLVSAGSPQVPEKPAQKRKLGRKGGKVRARP